MTSRDFCYWLQGFFELRAASPFVQTPNMQGLSEQQLALVQKHLSLVFVHEIDPAYGDEKHQEKLNEIHSAKPENQVSITPGPRPPLGGVDPITGAVYRC